MLDLEKLKPKLDDIYSLTEFLYARVPPRDEDRPASILVSPYKNIDIKFSVEASGSIIRLENSDSEVFKATADTVEDGSVDLRVHIPPHKIKGWWERANDANKYDPTDSDQRRRRYLNPWYMRDQNYSHCSCGW